MQLKRKEKWTIWTDEQLEFVKKHYSSSPQQFVLDFLKDKTWDAVRTKAKKVGCVRTTWDCPSRDWSQEDLDFLKENYSEASQEELCDFLERDWGTIQNKTSLLGLSRVNPAHWTPKEDSRLLDFLAQRIPLGEISKQISRTYEATARRSLIVRAGQATSYKKQQYLEWNDDLDQQLKDFIKQGLSTSEIATKLGRTESSIKNRRVRFQGEAIINDWSKNHDLYLQQNYSTSSQEEMVAHLGRAWSAIQKRATATLGLQRKGLVKKGQWPPEQDRLLKDLIARGKTADEIVDAFKPFGRGWEAIYYRASRGLKPALVLPKPRAWTPDEEAYLQKHYYSMEMDKLIIRLPRHTVSGIYNRAAGLGLEREKARWYREELMKTLLDQLFPHEEKQNNVRPDFLEKLEYDRYYPNLKIAYEYNGEQHYMPMSDSEESKENLEKQKIRDLRKIALSKTLGIALVVIKYDEELSVKLLKEKTEEACPDILFAASIV